MRTSNATYEITRYERIVDQRLPLVLQFFFPLLDVPIASPAVGADAAQADFVPPGVHVMRNAGVQILRGRTRRLTRFCDEVREVLAIQRTLYNIHCTRYTVHCTVYSVQCTHVVHCTVYNMHCTMCRVA